MLRMLITVTVILGVSSAEAARPIVTWGQVRTSKALILGTLHGVKPAEKSRTDGERNITIKGFSFSVRVHEVLRGKMEDEEFDVPFSAAGYATNWEFGAKPTDGQKVMGAVRDRGDGKWQPWEWPNGIRVLKSFDSQPVPFARRLARLWSIQEPAEVKQQIVEGCSSTERRFRSYCLEVLQRRSGTFTGVDIQQTTSESEALGLIWSVFSNPDSPVDAVLQCDNILWNRLRGENWAGHAPRADVLLRTIRREIPSASVQSSNSIDQLITGLDTFPGRQREAVDLLRQLLRSQVPLVRNRAAQRLGAFYEPHSTDKHTEKTNREIWQLIQKLLRSNKKGLAVSAAHAAGQIVMKSEGSESASEKVRVLQEISREIRQASAVAQLRAIDRHLQIPQPSRKLIDAARSSGARMLATPWSSLVGRKVVALGESGWRDGRFGATIPMNGRRLWIDGLASWPEAIRSGSPVVVTGRLAVRNDLKVFRVKAGEAFGEGLPVPDGYSLEESRKRYVLEEVKWHRPPGPR